MKSKVKVQGKSTLEQAGRPGERVEVTLALNRNGW